MTKKEFCEALVKLREDNGYSKNAISKTTVLTFQAVLRIERGTSNYALIKPIDYLNAMGYHLEVEGRNTCAIIFEPADAIEWFKQTKGNLSANALASVINVSPAMINFILSGKSSLTINVFLSICNYYNATIKFVKNGRGTKY